MILCWLYWLFAAALPLHLIAPSVVKGITQLPHSSVYSGPLVELGRGGAEKQPLPENRGEGEENRFLYHFKNV